MTDKYKGGIPFLNALLEIDDAFQSQRNKKTCSELIIFMRPRRVSTVCSAPHSGAPRL